MAVNEGYLEYVKEQMSLIGEIESKKMFGGMGFFKDGIMFGMIGGGVLRYRVDEENQADYEAKGMEPYRTKPNTKGMPYWEVPVEVLEDRDELKVWTEKAITVSIRNKK